jgi:phage gpG-like protein
VSSVTFRKGEKVRRIEKHLDRPKAALKQIGAMLVAESQQAFQRQRLTKKRWDARAPINVFGIISDFAMGRKKPPARRFDRRPALVDTGRLRSSIAFKVVGSKAVDVGTNLPYASAHQYGKRVDSEIITKDVQELLWKWLRGQGKQYKKDLGWLLNKKYTGTKLSMMVPKRPFVGVTARTRRDVKKAIGVHIMEVK